MSNVMNTKYKNTVKNQNPKHGTLISQNHNPGKNGLTGRETGTHTIFSLPKDNLALEN